VRLDHPPDDGAKNESAAKGPLDVVMKHGRHDDECGNGDNHLGGYFAHINNGVFTADNEANLGGTSERSDEADAH